MVYILENHKITDNNFKISDRKFGYTFTFLIFIYSIAPCLHHQKPKIIGLTLATILLLISYQYPHKLNYFNKQWMKLSLILKKTTTPIALFILFYCVICPIAIFLKLKKKDILNLKTNPSLETYWITKFNDSGTMKDQY